MKRVIVWCVFCVLFMAGCRVSDVREMTVKVPGLGAEADVRNVRAALATLGGIDHAKTVCDVTNHLVIVQYDSMVIAHKNIEIAIAEAGYDANAIRAIKKAQALGPVK
ncbi:MAG: heavy-metal-associated domain-containing protein [Verrucomicrobiota bacterium]|jgi:copper chaperone CopZ|nr:heavy-metal-associated domain-containing protein [Verrucomicrobiota bacterium]